MKKKKKSSKHDVGDARGDEKKGYYLEWPNLHIMILGYYRKAISIMQYGFYQQLVYSAIEL